MRLTINGTATAYDAPVRLEKVAKETNAHRPLAATVNGRLRELSYIVSKDAEIRFLSYDNADAIRIYETTLRYVTAMAVHHLFPKARVQFSYSISRSILGVLYGHNGTFGRAEMDAIKNEVRRIIKKDIPIIRRRIDLDDAITLYRSYGMHDKVRILKYREENFVNLYKADTYNNYMFGYMLPSTGYLEDFDMFLYHPGFLIRYPRVESGGKIPAFVDEPTFGRTLSEAASWGRIIKGNTIPLMNEYAKDRKSSVDFVNMCETKHMHMLGELGDLISKDIANIRLIGVAGPSSSGKTTFTNRLRIELMSRGIHPVMISIDDYYLGRDMAPKSPDGSPDLEHVDALDVERFNHDMLALIQGESVRLPHFNFLTGQREDGELVRLADDTPILIEGIHALNSKLTRSIPIHRKFNIYISPQTQLHIDDHNPISITELRLLRRIVRDQKYRNASASDTLEMWPSVRRGEFKWIYPTQKQANYVFNSELTYEFNVLKKHAVAQLKAIPAESHHFITANRLLKFLKYFRDIDDDIVPCNSLLREFIGGSSFSENT